MNKKKKDFHILKTGSLWDGWVRSLLPALKQEWNMTTKSTSCPWRPPLSSWAAVWQRWIHRYVVKITLLHGLATPAPSPFFFLSPAVLKKFNRFNCDQKKKKSSENIILRTIISYWSGWMFCSVGYSVTPAGCFAKLFSDPPILEVFSA